MLASASAVAYPRGGRLLVGGRCLGAPLLQGAAARTVSISSGTNASPWLRPGSRGALQVMGAATWTVTLKSTGPRRKGLQETSDRLDITLVDVHPDASGQEVKSDKYTTPLLHHSKPIVVSPGIDGWIRTENPKEGWADKIKQPGAILLKKSDGMVYVDTIELERKDDKEGSTKFEFPVFSWIAREQGERVFFASPAYLPHDTPKPLQKYRASELDTLKCDDGKKRQGAERKYGYQVYNDLGDARPFLGASKEYPYPRRLATNRGKPGENEPPPPKGESCAWLPYDDRFALRKEHDFKGGANQGLRMVALTLLDKVVDIIRRRYGESKWKVLTDYQDVIDLFGKQPYQPTSPEINPASSANIPGVSWKSVLAGDIDGDGDVDLADVKAFLMREEQKFLPLDLKLTSEQENLVLAKFLQCFEPDDRDDKEGQKRAQGKGDLTGAFPEPLVITRDVGRRDDNIWQSDAEMGRQMLAGINPCVLTALKSTPEQLGSAIRDEHIQGELPAGQTLASLVDAAKRGEKPRLYWVDYWGYTSVWDEPAEGNKPSLLEPDTRSPPLVHAGRALFYLKPSASDPNKDEALLPIAIELAHNDNHKRGSPLPTKGDVYSRAQLRDDKWVVWLLAKLVFRSLDSGYHQLISHWLRTHAVVEPFYIALRRNVSALHPVYKLMRPHFRYTLHINANARSSLVHKDSTIEAAFSPGEWAMRLSAKVYSSWRFTHQALPKDLELRGMVDKSGKPWCDYPYADDGLDVWRTFEAYFNAYLRLYYTDDAGVKADPELQNWWQEVKTKAHGDIMQFSAPQGKSAADPAAMEVECWGFAGPISSVQQLTQVLVTIAWLASAHHAAVNFGQYDFSSVLLNFSSKIRQPMPKLGSPEMQALVDSDQQQQAVLNYLAPFVLDHARVMVTVQLLSMHAMDEQTLEMPNQYLDERAQVLNKAFAAKLAELQQEFDRRNSKAAGCWTRTEGQESSVPYSLLTAPLGSGAYRRGGVPYSISI